jgi:hypothetical protein
VVASTTNVANLNASSLSGETFAAPGAIGGTTPSTGRFTTVGIGGAVVSGYPLTVIGSAAIGGSGARFQIGSTSETSAFLQAVANDGSSNADINFYVGGSPAVIISKTGMHMYPGTDNGQTNGASGSRWSAVWAANGTVQTSDAREKSNILPIADALSIVSSIQPMSYTKYGLERMGFLAQDVRRVLALHGIGSGTVQGDEAKEKLGMYDTDMIAPLWAGTRVLIEEVNTLKARVSALETANDNLQLKTGTNQ